MHGGAAVEVSKVTAGCRSSCHFTIVDWQTFFQRVPWPQDQVCLHLTLLHDVSLVASFSKMELSQQSAKFMVCNPHSIVHAVCNASWCFVCREHSHHQCRLFD